MLTFSPVSDEGRMSDSQLIFTSKSTLVIPKRFVYI